MVQAKFSLEESHIRFLNNSKKYGFKDKSEVIRTALDRLQKEIEREKLRTSAELYSEIYDEDKELRSLTDSAIAEWPE